MPRQLQAKGRAAVISCSLDAESLETLEHLTKTAKTHLNVNPSYSTVLRRALQMYRNWLTARLQAPLNAGNMEAYAELCAQERSKLEAVSDSSAAADPAESE